MLDPATSRANHRRAAGARRSSGAALLGYVVALVVNTGLLVIVLTHYVLPPVGPRDTVRIDTGPAAWPVDGGEAGQAAPLEPVDVESATTTSTTVGTTGSAAGGAPPGAVWPDERRRVGHIDPRAAARSFARSVGFRAPVAGRYQPIDQHSGGFDIRPVEGGPVTSVLLHQAPTDGSWWVIGALADEIAVDGPRFGATVDDPLHIHGTVRSTDGTVELDLRLVGDTTPILSRRFATGGGDTPQWFEGSFGWTSTRSGPAVLTLIVRDAEDGDVQSVTVIPVVVPDIGHASLSNPPPATAVADLRP